MLAQLNAHGDDPLTPVVVQRGLRRDQIDYLSEHSLQFPGVQTQDSFLRSYPYQSLAAQLVGYVGAISPSQYKQLKKKGYQATDSIGQAGVESTYDTYLRGKDGKAQLTVDSRGRPKGAAVSQSKPTPGEALRLTIDIKLQRAAERALRYGVSLAHSSFEGQHANGGAIVALSPKDGAVLAMASYPTYKPSIFAGRKDPQKLAPLLNAEGRGSRQPSGLQPRDQRRVSAGLHLQAGDGARGDARGLDEAVRDDPVHPTFKDHGSTFKNWTPLIDTGMTLTTALAQSCDTYFYELGKRFYNLPPDRGHPLQAWANRFGFGETSGLDVGPENPGLIATPEYRRKAFPASKGYGELDRTWKPGYSIQMAIGQNQVLVTPLQMARFYAMIANGGKLVTPHIADDVELTGAKGEPSRVLRRFGGESPQPTGVDPTALTYVQRGLEEATHSPNGTSSGVFGSSRSTSSARRVAPRS